MAKLESRTNAATMPGDGTDVGASDAWPAVLEQLVAGISHQLSNRVATLAGVSDLLAGDPTVPPILRALADEVPRLEESLRLLRLLSVPEGEGDEPVEPARALDDALTLVRVHPAARGVTFDVQLPPSLPPVIASPTRLTHRLVTALARAAEQGDRTVAVRANASDMSVDLVIDGEHVSVPTLTSRR